MIQLDVEVAAGRTLHVYDTAPAGSELPPVLWHHGTPNLGSPPEPLFAAAGRLGLRWVSFDRPGYGRSALAPGRTVASLAADAAAVADTLGIGRFAVVGYSGGGTYPLGCAAVLRDRVQAVLSLAGIAPYGADGLDWFAGMVPSGVAALGTAAAGREARAALQESGFAYDCEFTAADLAFFEGSWGWLGKMGEPALAADPYGQIDDDVSYTHAWGCDPGTISAPVLLLHGAADRIVPASHGTWLAAHCPTAELRLRADDSHFTITGHAEEGLDWLRRQI
ncbi:Pimeloyl-ACP methyl ester carboxylesterase [Nonomuraea solani]|uniref:Pimeloyl-ACP methyl ester carboxylesterase n=1 Tax=Nonomuraea solani TaxID=1144553 RepID=A0A1H6EV41_9ACTN|nr:alpha/beta hydrolase [Nonomuraea solani]SEH01757.1 Pimeloyl-ACP methyl ester carboxylesterase [Nonomuraea solani]